MLEGKCPKCGLYRCGWALGNPRYQTCPNCGVELDITDEGQIVSKGHSPSNTIRHIVDITSRILPTRDKKNSEREK